MVQRDHIPSYKALEVHFKQNGTNTTLKGNANAIIIPKIAHKKGSRTHSYRNKVSKYEKDANNLLIATFKDLAFTTTYLTLHNLNPTIYMKSALVLLEKNHELCLYN